MCYNDAKEKKLNLREVAIIVAIVCVFVAGGVGIGFVRINDRLKLNKENEFFSTHCRMVSHTDYQDTGFFSKVPATTTYSCADGTTRTRTDK